MHWKQPCDLFPFILFCSAVFFPLSFPSLIKPLNLIGELPTTEDFFGLSSVELRSSGVGSERYVNPFSKYVNTVSSLEVF